MADFKQATNASFSGSFWYGITESKSDTLTIGSGATAVTLIPTSLSVSPEAELKEIKGPTGVTIAVVCPEQTFTASGSGYIASQNGEVTIPKKGSLITMPESGFKSLPTLDDGYSWRLDSFSVEYANEDVAKVSFTVKSMAVTGELE